MTDTAGKKTQFLAKLTHLHWIDILVTEEDNATFRHWGFVRDLYSLRGLSLYLLLQGL
jgi:hypothetical protein